MKRNTLKTLAAIMAAIMLILPFAVFAEEGVTYEIGAALQVGEFEYEACDLEYTVYTFEPTEVGAYLLSCDAPIGIVSYNGMWATVEPSAATITENSLSWDCKSVGQSIWVAAFTNGSPVTINIEQNDIEIITIKTVAYKNTVVPTPFAFEEYEDPTTLIPVNVANSKIDYPVLGEDGYYHLNTESGPRLFVDLNDSVMAMYALREPGQISSIVYKEDGSVDYKLDYNAAFDEYWACADSSGMYPLTDDLIAMFIDVGTARGWYGEGGWLGYTGDDAWMFACYYLESEEIPYDMGAALEIGEIEYAPSEYKYTIYTFDPTETGNYVITSDAPLGIVSYTGMWVSIEPDATTVTENVLSWNCESIGQAIWVAAFTNGSPVTIKVELKELSLDEIETITYENKIAPTPFAFAEGENYQSLVPVNVKNSAVDTAVMGADGVYRLNDSTGPRIFVDLNDSQMSLAAAYEYGQLKISVMDEEGNLVSYIDYCSAFNEYFTNAHAASGCYPLTDDLMEMLIEIGTHKGWYGEEGWLGISAEDAWMYCCYYFEDDVYTGDDVTGKYTITIDGVEFGSFEAGETVELPAQAPTTISGFFARFYNYTGAEVTKSAYNKNNTVNGYAYSMVMPAENVELTSDYVILGNLVDSDQKVNSRDTAILKRLVSNPNTNVTEKQKAAADLQLDGKVNSRDTLLMKKIVTGTDSGITK